MPTVAARAAIALALVAVASFSLTACRADGSTPVPAASNAVTPAPTSTPSVIATPEPVTAYKIPATCDGLYSAETRAGYEASGVVLGRPDLDLSQYKTLGSNDDALAAFISGPGVKLTCGWWAAQGDSFHVGLRTNVVVADAATIAAAQARLTEMGITPASTDGGTRYAIEMSSEDGPYGESHFFRDDLWLATAWSQFGPDGYTANLVAQIFGPPAQ
ncbi:hypothetical protein ACFSBZ_14945 [Amnibacterium flavum]|nr:hypothetical protein [Amnibacterium flavum]